MLVVQLPKTAKLSWVNLSQGTVLVWHIDGFGDLADLLYFYIFIPMPLHQFLNSFHKTKVKLSVQKLVKTAKPCIEWHGAKSSILFSQKSLY